MANLSYSFCLSLLHSLWQAALLWAVYTAVSKSLGARFTPLQKRNMLFVSVAVQTVLSAITFLLLFFSYQPDNTAALNITNWFGFAATETAIGVTNWLLAAYTVIISYKLTRALYNWWWFKKQFKTTLIKPSVEFRLFTTSRKFHFGIKRNVSLWLSNTINTPFTFGFLKPVIVLPVALVNQLNTQQAEALILHELAHIKANDFLLNWFVIISETVFFFNPFILFICKQLKQEREKNCDLTVTSFNYQPLLYAEALLKAQTVKQLTTAAQYNSRLQIAAVNKPHHLLHRIQFFINPENQLQATRKKIILPVTALLFSFATIIILLLQILPVKKQVYAAALPSHIATEYNTDKLPSIVNNVLANLTDQNLEKIAVEAEKQMPAIEAAVKKLEPLIKEIEKEAAAMAEEIETNLATPVALQEPAFEKQILVKEEESGSKNATIKVYTIAYKNGKWQLQPQWKLSSKEITISDTAKLDTCAPEKASSSIPEEIQD